MQLEAVVGRGSMGRVYLGHWLGTEVAVKVLTHRSSSIKASRRDTPRSHPSGSYRGVWTCY